MQKLKNTNLSKLLLGILLMFEVVMLFYYNIKTDFSYDFDAAKVMYHTIKIQEAKTFLIDNWSYMTTGEWDCSMLLAIPLYSLTKNIFLSFAISNIINIIIFGLIVYTLFKNLDIEIKYALLALCIIFIPYAFSELAYTNMMFYSAGQYIYKVLTPISLLTVLHYKNKNSVIYYLLLLSTLFLMFLTITSSSLYVVMCGIFPIIACEIIYYLAYKKKISKQTIVEILLTCIVILFSYYVHKEINIDTNADGVLMVKSDDLMDSIHNTFLSLINVMDIFTNEEIYLFSFDGMFRLLKVVLFIFIIIYSISSLKKFLNLDKFFGFKKDDEESNTLIKSELISIFVINIFVCLLSQSSSRYLIIGFISLVLLAIITYKENDSFKYLDYLLIIYLLVLNIFGVKNAFLSINNNNPNRNFSKDYCTGISDLTRYYNTNDIVVFSISGMSEQMRLYDLEVNTYTFTTGIDSFVDYDVVNTITKLEQLDNYIFVIDREVKDEYYPVDLENYDMEFIQESYMGNDVYLVYYVSKK